VANGRGIAASGSLVLHVLAGLGLAVVRGGSPERAPTAITVEVRPPRVIGALAAAGAVRVPGPRPGARRATTPAPRRAGPPSSGGATPAHEPERSLTFPGVAPAPLPSPAPAHGVDLYPGAVLDGVARAGTPTAPGWGGVTHRAGDGSLPPGTRDAAADREHAAAQIHQWLDESAAEERASSGRIAPAWRDLERDVDRDFHPDVELVSEHNAVVGLAREFMNMARSPSTNGQLASAEDTFFEVEVVIGAAGQVLGTRVLNPSGRRSFDRYALEVIRRDIERRQDELAHPPHRVRTRWTFEAHVIVIPPTTAGLSFDEVTGHVQAIYPFQKKVMTHIALRSIGDLD
jgi:hypothetical protein